MATLQAVVDKILSHEVVTSYYSGVRGVPDALRQGLEDLLESFVAHRQDKEFTDREALELEMAFSGQVGALLRADILASRDHSGLPALLNGFKGRASIILNDSDPDFDNFKDAFYNGYDAIKDENTFGQATNGVEGVFGVADIDAGKKRFKDKLGACLASNPLNVRQLKKLSDWLTLFTFIDRHKKWLNTSVGNTFGIPTGNESATGNREEISNAVTAQIAAVKATDPAQKTKELLSPPAPPKVRAVMVGGAGMVLASDSPSEIKDPAQRRIAAIKEFNQAGDSPKIVDVDPPFTIQNVEALWNNGNSIKNVRGLLVVLESCLGKFTPQERVRVANSGWFKNLVGSPKVVEAYCAQSFDVLLTTWNESVVRQDVAYVSYRKAFVCGLLTKDLAPAEITRVPESVVDFILAQSNPLEGFIPAGVEITGRLTKLLEQSFSASGPDLDRRLNILRLLTNVAPQKAQELWQEMPVTSEVVIKGTVDLAAQSSEFVDQLIRHAILVHERILPPAGQEARNFLETVRVQILPHTRFSREKAFVTLCSAYSNASVPRGSHVAVARLQEYAQLKNRLKEQGMPDSELQAIEKTANEMFPMDSGVLIELIEAAKEDEGIDRADISNQSVDIALQAFLAGKPSIENAVGAIQNNLVLTVLAQPDEARVGFLWGSQLSAYLGSLDSARLGAALGPHREALEACGLSRVPEINKALALEAERVRQLMSEEDRAYGAFKETLSQAETGLPEVRALVANVNPHQIIGRAIADDDIPGAAKVTLAIAVLGDANAVARLQDSELQELVQLEGIGQAFTDMPSQQTVENLFRIFAAMLDVARASRAVGGRSYQMDLANTILRVDEGRNVEPTRFNAVVEANPRLVVKWLRNFNDEQVIAWVDQYLNTDSADATYKIFEGFKSSSAVQQAVAMRMVARDAQGHNKFERLTTLADQYAVLLRLPRKLQKGAAKQVVKATNAMNNDQLSDEQWGKIVLAVAGDPKSSKAIVKKLPLSKLFPIWKKLADTEDQLIQTKMEAIAAFVDKDSKGLPTEDEAQRVKHANGKLAKLTNLSDAMYGSKSSDRDAEDMARHVFSLPENRVNLSTARLASLVEVLPGGLSSPVLDPKLSSDHSWVDLRQELTTRFVAENRVVSGMERESLFTIAQQKLRGKTSQQAYADFLDLESRGLLRPYSAAVLLRRTDLLKDLDPDQIDELLSAQIKGDDAAFISQEMGNINYQVLSKKGIWLPEMNAGHLQVAIDAAPVGLPRRKALADQIPKLIRKNSFPESVTPLARQYCQEGAPFESLQVIDEMMEVSPKKQAIAQGVYDYLLKGDGILQLEEDLCLKELHYVCQNIEPAALKNALSMESLAALAEYPGKQEVLCARLTAVVDKFNIAPDRKPVLENAIGVLKKMIEARQAGMIVMEAAAAEIEAKKQVSSAGWKIFAGVVIFVLIGLGAVAIDILVATGVILTKASLATIVGIAAPIGLIALVGIVAGLLFIRWGMQQRKDYLSEIEIVRPASVQSSATRGEGLDMNGVLNGLDGASPSLADAQKDPLWAAFLKPDEKSQKAHDERQRNLDAAVAQALNPKKAESKAEKAEDAAENKVADQKKEEEILVAAVAKPEHLQSLATDARQLITWLDADVRQFKSKGSFKDFISESECARLRVELKRFENIFKAKKDVANVAETLQAFKGVARQLVQKAEIYQQLLTLAEKSDSKESKAPVPAAPKLALLNAAHDKPFGAELEKHVAIPAASLKDVILLRLTARIKEMERESHEGEVWDPEVNLAKRTALQKLCELVSENPRNIIAHIASIRADAIHGKFIDSGGGLFASKTTNVLNELIVDFSHATSEFLPLTRQQMVSEKVRQEAKIADGGRKPVQQELADCIRFLKDHIQAKHEGIVRVVNAIKNQRPASWERVYNAGAELFGDSSEVAEEKQRDSAADFVDQHQGKYDAIVKAYKHFGDRVNKFEASFQRDSSPAKVRQFLDMIADERQKLDKLPAVPLTRSGDRGVIASFEAGVNLDRHVKALQIHAAPASNEPDHSRGGPGHSHPSAA